ncbi:hypothetical protein [Salipiger sp.]|uniref:hypothetical protein n=1 Tax=Salipiger sp. TaxID=2078585 RepID=UPI003A9739A7
MSYFEALDDSDLVLDALPDAVTASLDVRNASLQSLSVSGHRGLEFIVSDLRSWRPRSALRVAFLDGDQDLHGDIAHVAGQIGTVCGMTLDFGELADGSFRRWSEADTDHAADIRVSFDKRGNFSLVGTDSIDGSVGDAFGTVGGRPGQTSLNLGGFAVKRPAGWRGTVLHEFLHALGFHHAHQNMRGPCQAAFRWEDDEGYQPCRDGVGRYISDRDGRRPGIYTYLAGYPNHWDRAKVDRNLKTEEDPAVIAGPFDPASVMLYRFPPLFYRTTPSACAPVGDGQTLSEGDIRGLQLLYPPHDGGAGAEAYLASQKALLGALDAAEAHVADNLETPGGAAGLPVLRSAAQVLRRKLDG